jgi:hypothetical protein
MPLNKSLFNPRLYTRIHELWFGSIPATATVPTEVLQERWFPRDAAVKEAFDAECRANLAETLEAIRPGSASVEELQSDLAAELQVCFMSRRGMPFFFARESATRQLWAFVFES